MHYAINYNADNRALNDANAVRDAIEYLGADRWNKSFGLFVQKGTSFAKTPYSVKKQVIQQIRFCCMLSGIRGYPVAAIIRTVWACHP
jgi:hypothetical protein